MGGCFSPSGRTRVRTYIDTLYIGMDVCLFVYGPPVEGEGAARVAARLWWWVAVSGHKKAPLSEKEARRGGGGGVWGIMEL